MISTEKIKALPSSTKVELRRAFGKHCEDMKQSTAIAFYSIAPENMSLREMQNTFFTTTLYCHYGDKADNGIKFCDAVSEHYRKSTDSGKHELTFFLDAPYSVHGTFFSRLYSLIRRMEKEGIVVDAHDLYKELKYWDSRSKTRKIEIAKRINATKEETENDN